MAAAGTGSGTVAAAFVKKLCWRKDQDGNDVEICPGCRRTYGKTLDKLLVR
jgi:hypothetical protein